MSTIHETPELPKPIKTQNDASIIYSALVDFKKSFPGVPSKNKKVQAGSRSYSYADYAAVRAEVDPHLSACGLFVTHRVEGEDLSLRLVTTVVHRSGQEFSDEGIPLFISKSAPNIMQALGSAVTYAKRYGLMCLLGLGSEDEDDDAGATAPKKQAPQSSSRHWDPPQGEVLPLAKRPNGHSHSSLTKEELIKVFKNLVTELSEAPNDPSKGIFKTRLNEVKTEIKRRHTAGIDFKDEDLQDLRVFEQSAHERSF